MRSGLVVQERTRLQGAASQESELVMRRVWSGLGPWLIAIVIAVGLVAVFDIIAKGFG